MILLALDPSDEEFAEAQQNWHLSKLYVDLAVAKHELAPYKRKGLTASEKLHLRGLLCGYSPADIATKLCKSRRGVETDLCNTLYRYTEVLTDRPTNTLKNWRDVAEWLEASGYKRSLDLVQDSPAQASISEVQFVAGPPIAHPRDFFGREREIKRLFGLLKRLPLQNAAIIGPRRSGKTSLLRYLEHITTTPPNQLRPGQDYQWLSDPAHYRWVFVDLQDPRLGTQAGLLQYILNRLNLPTPSPCSLNDFLDVMSDELQHPTIILLDEIGVALTRYPELDDSFWEALRSLATNHVGGKLAFILAAHESPIELSRQTGHSSPFFNIFGYTTTLGAFTEAEARSLIASSPRSFPESDVDWILNQSKGWAILLQIFCRERLLALENGETDAKWQDDALQQIEPFQYLLDL